MASAGNTTFTNKLTPPSNHFYMGPINNTQESASNVLAYNTLTNEISYTASTNIPTPNLQTVTTAGNITNEQCTFTNGMTISGGQCMISSINVNEISLYVSQNSSLHGNVLIGGCIIDTYGGGTNGQVLTSTGENILWKTIPTNSFYTYYLPTSPPNNVSGTITIPNIFTPSSGFYNAKVSFYFYNLAAGSGIPYNTCSISLISSSSSTDTLANYNETFSNSTATNFSIHDSTIILGNIGGTTGGINTSSQMIELDLCNINNPGSLVNQLTTFQIRGMSYGCGPSGTDYVSEGQRTAMGVFKQNYSSFITMVLTFTAPAGPAINLTQGSVDINVYQY